ncbi:transglutaminase-like domain-containing protein [Amycolatopsis cihanbeyliensis]|uniref:Transglutaminase superfamily protein n=1 Tax=Amycolatopsis cihanbeyliensis TaxID=1128664 RepID=A0A542DDJ9_AMYCI|nr:transglutaminase family protein [Amycolatopsis cihanbeyliensis]TQJ01133.1 transglutaminase superfamily protein [Amycolatopsis cihanbeyliensis]
MTVATGRSALEAELSLRVTKPGRLALSVAAAESAGVDTERLEIEGPSGSIPAVPPAELPHGTKIHVLDLPPGEVTISYRAERDGGPVEPIPLTEADLITYTRPSRYCPSDRMIGIALADFGRLPDPLSKVRAIVSYVAQRLVYVSGSSRPTDGALDTLLAGEGVCRDFAHLCVTYCRGLDIPARFVSVYAPGLSPMDFHAVFEAAIDGRWYMFDASRLAPRSSMVRIATGRDAADTAFLSTLGSEIDLRTTRVNATVVPATRIEEITDLVALA